MYLIAEILLVTVIVTAAPKAKRTSAIIVFPGMLTCVGLCCDPFLQYCAFRDGTTSESEIGTPVKKQRRTGLTEVVSDSELSSPVKRYMYVLR